VVDEVGDAVHGAGNGPAHGFGMLRVDPLALDQPARKVLTGFHGEGRDLQAAHVVHRRIGVTLPAQRGDHVVEPDRSGEDHAQVPAHLAQGPQGIQQVHGFLGLGLLPDLVQHQGHLVPEEDHQAFLSGAQGAQRLEQQVLPVGFHGVRDLK